jgi:hypothetical protein
MGFIATLPEWVYLILTLMFVLVSYEVGFKFGLKRKLKPGENPDAAAGALSGTTLGLLAFILAFTFNGASADFSVRKDLLIQEANAIRSAYQQSLVLPDPYRDKTRELLREYTDIRVNASKTFGSENIKQSLDRTMAIQAEMWSTALNFQQKNASDRSIADPLKDALVKIADLHVERFHAVFQSRINIVIWGVLFLLTFLTMSMMGYRVGLTGVRSAFVEVFTALAFSSVLILIISLDRPNGMLKINQAPMIEVLHMLSVGK